MIRLPHLLHCTAIPCLLGTAAAAQERPVQWRIEEISPATLRAAS